MRRQIMIDPSTKIVRLGGRPTRMVLTLLIIHGVLFLTYAFADGPRWVAEQLAVSGQQTIRGYRAWQPFSAMWIHLRPSAFLLNMLALWMFGCALERWWGAKRFLLFHMSTSIAGLIAAACAGLAWPNIAMAGVSGSAAGMALASAVLFPVHMVFLYGLIPLKNKIFSLLMLSFLIIGAIVGRQWLEVAAHLAGLLVAVVFVGRLRQRWAQWRLKQIKRKYKVIEGGKKDKWVN